MFEGITCIGLDVHKRSIVIAVRRPGDPEVYGPGISSTEL